MREIAGYTQNDFSEAMAVSIRTTQNWESKDEVPDKYIDRILEVLKPRLEPYSSNEEVKYFLYRISGKWEADKIDAFEYGEELRKQALAKNEISKKYEDSLFLTAISDEEFISSYQDSIYSGFEMQLRFYLINYQHDPFGAATLSTNLDRETLKKLHTREVPITSEVMVSLHRSQFFFGNWRTYFKWILEEYRFFKHKNGSQLPPKKSFDFSNLIGGNSSQNFYINKSGNAIIEYPESGLYQIFTPLVTKQFIYKYLTSWGDNDFLHTLPQFPFILKQPLEGKFLTVEYDQDNMNGEKYDDSIQEGNYVTGKKIDRAEWAKSDTKFDERDKPDYIIHNRSVGLTIFRITEHNIDDGYILCHSLHPDKEKYPDVKLDLAEISEIYYVLGLTKLRSK